MNSIRGPLLWAHIVGGRVKINAENMKAKDKVFRVLHIFPTGFGVPQERTGWLIKGLYWNND